MMIRSLIASLSLLAMPATAQHAHHHGRADLAIVVDGATLTIELRADMMDVVGFEHAPEDDAQAASVRRLHEGLTTAAPPFALPDPAGCDPSGVSTKGGFAPNSTPADDGVEDHILVATWTWQCKTPSRLRRIATSLFDSFPAIEVLDAVILTEAAQTGAKMTAKSPSVRLPK